MENKIIGVQDLEIGDEVLISCQSFFKYLKILSEPKLSNTKVHWRTKRPLYGNVMCSTKREEVISYSYTDPQGIVHNRMSKKWITTSEDHNIKVSQDFNNRQIWLVKRER
jgi:hypothetical protein